MEFAFLERLEANCFLTCWICKARLVRTDALASLDVHERPGTTCALFPQVSNVFLDQEKDVQFSTGRYTVKDVFCCCCCQCIGWRYVRAHDEAQSYKNGLYGIDQSKVTLLELGDGQTSLE